MPRSTHRGSEGPGLHHKLKRLLIRPGAIGDVVVSLPALEFLRADYTEVWTPSRTVPLIRFADRVRPIASTGLDMVGITESTALDELARFDSICSWYGANRPEFRQAVARFPFTFFDALPACGSVHAVDYYLTQVGAEVGAIPRIDVPRSAGDFVAIHPFSGSPKKNWPLERYLELARMLQTDVRFCAGQEQELAGAVRIEDLYELAQWLASARLYIGNDSGITHLAAAVGTPVIALFGPTDPAIWAPRGTNVRVLHKSSIEAISIAEVVADFRPLWYKP